MRNRDIVVESESFRIFGEPVTWFGFLESRHVLLGDSGGNTGDTFLFQVAVDLDAVTSATAIGIDVVVTVGEVGVAEPEVFA